jgi:pilus assembly protein CpaF
MRTLSRPRRSAEAAKATECDSLKRRIHNKVVDKLDLTKVGDLQRDVLRREIRLVVEHLWTRKTRS